MRPTDMQAESVVRLGLNQLPTLALIKAEKEIIDHPEKILMDGRVFDAGRY